MTSVNSIIYKSEPANILTTEAIQACKLLKISPDDLRAKTEEEFVQEGFEPHIANLRFEHHSHNRKKKLQMVINFIQTGLVHEFDRLDK